MQKVINGKVVNFTPVVGKKFVGPRKVYDLEVAGVHNYFANGVNVHNCSYFDMLDYNAEKYGVELYRKKDEFIKIFHKNLKFYPTHPNGNVLRGDTRILAVIDELGLFPLPTGDDEEDEQSARANADEAHKSLTNSLTTVQAVSLNLLQEGINAPGAYMMGVSSPMSVRDKVMRLLKDSQSEEGRKYILGVNLPTWKVNPTIHRDTPIIKLAYARNPVKAERDFGANPPKVNSPFITQGTMKKELFQIKQTHSLTFQYDVPGMLYAKVERQRTLNYPTLVTVDAGSVDNSFCLTAAYFDFETNKTSICTMLEIMPHEGRAIDFNLTYQHVILPICKDLNAVALLADQWQSLDILHRAREDRGKLPDGKPVTATKQHSPRRKDFNTYLSMLQNGNLLLPLISPVEYQQVIDGQIENFRSLIGKPVQHYLLQALTVKDTHALKCPTKGDGNTDDIFRASVLLTKIHEPVIMDRLKYAHLHKTGTASKNPRPVYVSRR